MLESVLGLQAARRGVEKGQGCRCSSRTAVRPTHPGGTSELGDWQGHGGTGIAPCDCWALLLSFGRDSEKDSWVELASGLRPLSSDPGGLGRGCRPKELEASKWGDRPLPM